MRSITVNINPNLYGKDPSGSELGLKILKEGLRLMDEIGFEAFTFKKLAYDIDSTEATLYRYFDNKHVFLLYLINWYWGIIDYRLKIATANIVNPSEKLKRALHVLTGLPDPTDEGSFPEEATLKRLLINESSKAYHTKMVDYENQMGVYVVYKSIVARLAKWVLEVNPSFPYPEMLISTLIENANQQRFFLQHLPRLTNDNPELDTVEAFSLLVLNKTIQMS
ncbi:MAG: TetR/AcrR family transcriptional regulator [Flavobacteriales bacterium]